MPQRHPSFPLVLLLASAAACTSSSPPTADAGLPPSIPGSELADPFVGSGGFGYMAGSAFPGALVPRGLCKVGPDTNGEFGTTRFLHYVGYWFDDTHIQAFTHLHLHGTGATDYGIIGLMPTPTFDDAMTRPGQYQSSFNKASEEAAPGHYAVELDKGPIRVDLTATEHVAFHRYRWLAGTTGHVIVDLDKHLQGGVITSASLTLDPATRTLTGTMRHVGEMSDGFGGYDVWFHGDVSRAWTRSRTWSNGAAPMDGVTATGTGVGAVLDFDVDAGTELEIRLAVSLVSADGARANFEAEAGSMDYVDAQAAATRAWANVLDTFKVYGGTQRDLRTFFSSWYHAHLMFTRVGDANGDYRLSDGTVARAEGYRFVNDMSLWDTYRTLHPLLDIVAHEDSRDAVRSLLAMGEKLGGLPRWPLATGESGTMLGAPADIVIGDAALKGVPGFDAAAALEFARAAAMDVPAPATGRGSRGDVELYIQNGYVPAERARSASMTVEYAHADAALGNMAALLGQTDVATALLERSRSWRRIFDPATGFLRARYSDGGFGGDAFSPTAFAEDYAEATAWQTLWGAPHDVDGLIELLGGRAAAVTKLESFMEQGKADFESMTDPFLFAAGPRNWFWPSNQPSIHVPYMFAQLGRPDLAQRWVRWTMRNYFSDTPEGLPGNDDGGTMSSWFVFSALGFYPVPGTDIYVVGAPLFPRVEMRVPGGVFTVDAVNASEENLYVQSVELNGAPLSAATFRHAELRPGGVLKFTMGNTPSSWARVE